MSVFQFSWFTVHYSQGFLKARRLVLLLMRQNKDRQPIRKYFVYTDLRSLNVFFIIIILFSKGEISYSSKNSIQDNIKVFS
jgi:hypothetical protein